MISPSIHRELARQRQADFLREAEQARLAAKAPHELPSVAVFSRALGALHGLSLLARREPQAVG